MTNLLDQHNAKERELFDERFGEKNKGTDMANLFFLDELGQKEMFDFTP